MKAIGMPKEVYMVIVLVGLMIGIFGLLFQNKAVPNEIIGCLIAALGGFFGYAQHRTEKEIPPNPENPEIKLLPSYKPDSNDSDIPVI